jgi:hypothetical protein
MLRPNEKENLNKVTELLATFIQSAPIDLLTKMLSGHNYRSEFQTSTLTAHCRKSIRQVELYHIYEFFITLERQQSLLINSTERWSLFCG